VSKLFVYVVTREFSWGGDTHTEVVGVAADDAAADRVEAEHREGLRRNPDGRTITYEVTEYEVAA
jgi:hypothetical protein